MPGVRPRLPPPDPATTEPAGPAASAPRYPSAVPAAHAAGRYPPLPACGLRPAPGRSSAPARGSRKRCARRARAQGPGRQTGPGCRERSGPTPPMHWKAARHKTAGPPPGSLRRLSRDLPWPPKAPQCLPRQSMTRLSRVRPRRLDLCRPRPGPAPVDDGTKKIFPARQDRRSPTRACLARVSFPMLYTSRVKVTPACV